MKRYPVLVPTWIVVITLLLAGCLARQQAQPTATAQPESTPAPKAITISFFQEPDSLNFLYTSTWSSLTVMDLTQRGLWIYDNQEQIVPELAAEIPSRENGGISEDGQTVTVKLRQGIRWQDGQPVTSADVKFTYDAIMNPNNAVATRYPYEDYIESIETPDEYTVVMHFSYPFASWWTTFIHVLPKHLLGDLDSLDTAEWNRAPIGFGPFRVKEWVSGDHITLEKNPDYWRGAPKLDTIYVKIVPSAEAQMAAIQAGGQVDMGTYHSHDEIAVLEGLGTVDVKSHATGYNEDYFFNLDPETGHPAFQDVRVRRAVAMSIDREQIIKNLMRGLSTVPRSFWDGTSYVNEAIPAYPYDPATAAKLLDEAGWTDHDGDGVRDKDGLKLAFTHRTTNERRIRLDAQLSVQQMLKTQGIEMIIENTTTDILFGGYSDDGPLYKGEYDMAGWSDGGVPDPGTISYYWMCDGFPSDENPEGGNFQFYCNTELDELLGQEAVTVDPQERKAVFDRIQQIMYDEVLLIPMWSDPDLWSLNKRLQNVQLGGWTPFWNAHEWDVAAK